MTEQSFRQGGRRGSRARAKDKKEVTFLMGRRVGLKQDTD